MARGTTSRSLPIPTFREGPPLPTPTDVVEALLFASDTPLEAERIREVLERGLLRVAGRKEAPGRPFLYETTREFLVAFGLRDLNDLPKVEGELVIPEVGVAPNGQAQAEQDPGPGGADVTAGS